LGGWGERKKNKEIDRYNNNQYDKKKEKKI